MTITSNRAKYLWSLGAELEVQSTRIRDLIGNSHWLSDGHHKEYLLGALIERHLPAGVRVGRGFVLAVSEPQVCSTEQDLLIVDTRSDAPIFDQGGVLVAFARSVLAAVSVKTVFAKVAFVDAVKGLNTVRAIAGHDGLDTRRIWCGGYFFEPGTTRSQNIVETIGGYADKLFQKLDRPRIVPLSSEDQPVGPDLLAISPDFVVRFAHETQTTANGRPNGRVRGYSSSGAAASFLLADILAHIESVRGDRSWAFEDFVQAVDVNQLGEHELNQLKKRKKPTSGRGGR